MKDPEYFHQEADRHNMGERRVDDAWRIETAKHPAPTVTARLLIISLSMLNTNPAACVASSIARRFVASESRMG
jgi:hypothetical protein